MKDLGRRIYIKKKRKPEKGKIWKEELIRIQAKTESSLERGQNIVNERKEKYIYTGGQKYIYTGGQIL